MKLDLDFSAVPRFLHGILTELREKRLWPVAAVLLAALVAVPFFLSKSSGIPSAAPVPQPTPAPSPAAGLPALSVQSMPPHSRIRGPAHDPFAQPAGSASTTSSTATATATGGVATVAPGAGAVVSTLPATSGATSPNLPSGGSTSSSGPTVSSTSSTGTSSTGTSTGMSSSASAPHSITGNAKPKPAPSGLTSTQSYDVGLAVTNSSGGVHNTDPLERLSVISSNRSPLLVELGVLRGGKRVLFAVQPGTVLNGPGTCIPGPVNCEILSVAQNQTESVASRAGGAAVLLAVTGITAAEHSSAAAANKVREAKSAAGRAVLDGSSLPALSLFAYKPGLGSVVDLRTLKVRAS